MPLALTDRAKGKFQAITSIPDFEDTVKLELNELSKLTDDVALVVVGHLYIEKKCIDVLGAFFNYQHADSRISDLQYGALVNHLQLSNLCNEKVVSALRFLGTLRNTFAHDIVSLSLLDPAMVTFDQKLADAFNAICQGFKVAGVSSKERFIDVLKKLYVELRKAELLAIEIDRFTNTPEFIEALNPITL